VFPHDPNRKNTALYLCCFVDILSVAGLSTSFALRVVQPLGWSNVSLLSDNKDLVDTATEDGLFYRTGLWSIKRNHGRTHSD
jgi:hypothetical protein